MSRSELVRGRSRYTPAQRRRDLGPIAVMWVATMLVIVYQNDLGTGMLFYGMFVVMLYITTERVGWAILAE
jgi:cell division protein FtsW (lipid II flippase)